MHLADFLEKVAPGRWADIEGLVDSWEDIDETVVVSDEATLPSIQLHCDHRTCEGKRVFEPREEDKVSFGPDKDAFRFYPERKKYFITYICRNCRVSRKVFAIWFERTSEDSPHGKAFKFGEYPAYGPQIPSRVIRLMGPDRELFLKGRRAENLGLGIGAFAYYRQAVENQKGRIINQIADVASKLNASKESIELLKKASKEQQFSTALDMIGDAFPKALLHENHNPLQLLHTALSRNLHEGTDEECLELAYSIRVVLFKLAAKITEVLQDEEEWKKAISTLLNPKTQDTPEAKPLVENDETGQ